jgi:hypothetical protein
MELDAPPGKHQRWRNQRPIGGKRGAKCRPDDTPIAFPVHTWPSSSLSANNNVHIQTVIDGGKKAAVKY